MLALWGLSIDIFIDKYVWPPYKYLSVRERANDNYNNRNLTAHVGSEFL